MSICLQKNKAALFQQLYSVHLI